jgi:hypothetical protein
MAACFCLCCSTDGAVGKKSAKPAEARDILGNHVYPTNVAYTIPQPRYSDGVMNEKQRLHAIAHYASVGSVVRGSM